MEPLEARPVIVCKGHVRFVRYIARRGNSCSTSPWGSVQLSSMTFFFTTHSLTHSFTHSFTYSLTPWQWLRLPRAQALEGAPAQLIGANFKKKIRPRQIIKVTSLQCRINLAAKVPFSCWRPFEALAPGCWRPSLYATAPWSLRPECMHGKTTSVSYLSN